MTAVQVHYDRPDNSWSSGGHGGWCGSHSDDPARVNGDLCIRRNDFATQPETSSQTMYFYQTGTYVLPAGAFFDPTGATSGAIAVNALTGHPVVVVGDHAGRVVVDLSAITAYAYSQYTTLAASTLGGGLGSTGATAWPTFPTLLNVGGTGGVYVPCPIVTIMNKSETAAYATVLLNSSTTALLAVSSKGAFEGVSPSIRVSPRDSVTLRFLPQARRWTVIDP